MFKGSGVQGLAGASCGCLVGGEFEDDDEDEDSMCPIVLVLVRDRLLSVPD